MALASLFFFLLRGAATEPYNDSEHRPRADGLLGELRLEERRGLMLALGYPKWSRWLEGWLILTACGAMASAQVSRGEGDNRSTFSPAPAREPVPAVMPAPLATPAPALAPLSLPTQASQVSMFPLAAPGLVERAMPPSPMPQGPLRTVWTPLPPLVPLTAVSSLTPAGEFYGSQPSAQPPALVQSRVSQAQAARPYPSSGEKPVLLPMAPASPVTRLEVPREATGAAITGVVTPRTTL
jgi:hypothetical protein